MGMSNVNLAWGDDAPEPLLYACSRNIATNPEVICDKKENGWNIKNDIKLPEEMCERLIDVWQDIGPAELNDEFLNIFSDKNSTRLKKVNLRNSSVTDIGLKSVVSHKLKELDILDCTKLTKKSLDYINKYGNDLLSLSLTKNIFMRYWEQDEGNTFILQIPKLQKLILRDFQVVRNMKFYTNLLKPLTNLCYLDLSGCSVLEEISNGIHHLKNLRTLILHCVSNIEKTVPSICTIKSLRYLDISQEKLENGMFTTPDAILEQIAMSLPNLTRLDISGTNLAGFGNFNYKKFKENIDLHKKEELCDIPGLQCRVSTPLEFLGLYNTLNDACKRHFIPAHVITGDMNENQILAASEAYTDRPSVLVKALNELFHLFRFETCTNHKRALNAILIVMKKHKTNKHIQISGSASLFYIAKDEEKSKLNFFVKRCIVRVLIDSMDSFSDDMTIMRNGCLTICQFRIPRDIETGETYKKLVDLLLRFVKQNLQQEDFVRKVAMYLLNSLACQVNEEQKLMVGDLGAIETMLEIINDRLSQGFHDDVLEIAWSTMWNVTDETPINCQRFLDEKGMKYFQRCLTEFPDKDELLRNMMGLLGNVAEVKYLRPRLLRPDFIRTFAYLLDSDSDGIEISYNAAGVLSHIASDGPEKWTITEPSRQSVLSKLVEAIDRWDLKSKRNINYRSFEPILRLVRVYHTPECQLWALWALANLTSVNPAKYCSLVEEEGGVIMIEEVAKKCENSRILELISKIQQNCCDFKMDSAQDSLELSPS